MATESSTPSLREAQRAVTEQRIVVALADLIDDEHPFEISMSAVARRAGVSEPTLYRHFPTKRDLFAALAGWQFQNVTSGLAPRTPAELAEAVAVVYEWAAERENTVRWTLAGTDPARIPRPHAQDRLAMLRTALGAGAAEPGEQDHAEFLLRVVLLLTSPMAWLYWKDYLGLDPAQASATAGWAIRALAEAEAPAQAADQVPPAPASDR